MTKGKRPTEGKSDRDEVDENAPAPMANFKKLAKRLIGVPREELEEQQRQYERKRPKR